MSIPQARGYPWLHPAGRRLSDLTIFPTLIIILVNLYLGIAVFSLQNQANNNYYIYGYPALMLGGLIMRAEL
jgi:hypothetical protein